MSLLGALLLWNAVVWSIALVVWAGSAGLGGGLTHVYHPKDKGQRS